MEYRPRIVSWNITGACHLRCGHCYLDARTRWPNELTPREGLRLIDQMAEAGTELLILTGGEPLLRKDLPDLARHAAEKGINVVLGTTGMQIDRRRARLLRDSGVTAAGISIDSLDPDKHDEFRGVPGAWQRAVGGIDACHTEGLDVLVHTTAMKMNSDEVLELIEFAHLKGARAFQLFFLVCTGRGERLTDLTPEEYERLLGQILDAQGSYPGMMVLARCAPYIGRMASQRNLSLAWAAGCLAGTSYCRVTPSGDVTPCPYLPKVAGNVRDRDFGTIWDSAWTLAQFRAPRLQLQGKCGDCAFSQGSDPICVGCRARAYALEGDELAADPWCSYEQRSEPAAPILDAPEARGSDEQTPITWTNEAEQRLSRVPSFIRGRVRQSAESYARVQGLTQVTTAVLTHLRERAFGGAPRNQE